MTPPSVCPDCGGLAYRHPGFEPQAVKPMGRFRCGLSRDQAFAKARWLRDGWRLGRRWAPRGDARRGQVVILHDLDAWAFLPRPFNPALVGADWHGPEGPAWIEPPYRPNPPAGGPPPPATGRGSPTRGSGLLAPRDGQLAGFAVGGVGAPRVLSGGPRKPLKTPTKMEGMMAERSVERRVRRAYVLLWIRNRWWAHMGILWTGTLVVWWSVRALIGSFTTAEVVPDALATLVPAAVLVGATEWQGRRSRFKAED